MNISSTRRPLQNSAKNPAPSPPKAPSLLHKFPLSEAMVETPEILLGLSGLQDSSPTLGNGLRLGVGSLALLRAVQMFQADAGLPGNLEGFSALGLAVAGGASVLDGSGAQALGRGGEVVHGLSEMALGISDVHRALHTRTEGLSPQLAMGLLTLTKGATTFLPMLLPSAATAVAITQLGILGARSLLAQGFQN